MPRRAVADEYHISITIQGRNDARAAMGGVKTDLDGVTQAADRSSKGVGGFFANMLSTAGGFLAANVIGGITSKIGDLAKGMIAGNAEFEKYETQFGVLLGSAQAAKDRLAELAAFGASTPFELPELVRADKILTSFGLHNQEMLTIVGDVAAGTGTAYEEMALLMGKFSAGATGEALARFQELGVATKDELAKMGIAFDKAGSMTTPVAEAMPILEQLMRDKFGGMMEAQSKTFDGMLSNLQDWVGGTLRTIGQPIFEVLKDKLGVLIEFLGKPETKAAIDAIAVALSQGIGTAIDFLGSTAIPALTDAWNTLQPAIAVVAEFLVSTVAPALEQAWTFIQANLTPILYGLATALLVVVVPAFISWAAGAAAAAVATIAALAPVLIPIAAIGVAVALLKAAWDSNFLGIRTALTNFWNGYGLPIFNTLKQWLATNIPVAIRVLTDFWDNTLLPTLKVVWSFIKDQLIPIFVTIAVGTFNTVRSSIQSLSDFWNNILMPAVRAVWDFLNTYIIPIFRAVANVEIALLKLALRSLAEFWSNTLKPAINAVWSFLDTYVIPLFKALVNVHIAAMKLAVRELADLWKDTLKPALDAVWSFIDRNINPIFRTLSDTAIGGVKSASTSLSGVWNDTLKPALNTVSDVINNTAKPAFDVLKGVADSVKGAISGIGDAISDVIGWLNDLADKINNLPSLPDVPGLAGGTNFAPGGMALVGERGPELVFLPRGSQVLPNDRTRSVLAGRSGGSAGSGVAADRSAPTEKHYHLHLNVSPEGVGSQLREFQFLEAYAVS